MIALCVLWTACHKASVCYSLQAAIGNSGRTDDELEHLSMVIEPRQRDSASLNSSKVRMYVWWGCALSMSQCAAVSTELVLSAWSCPEEPVYGVITVL